ncbi:amidohydrolase family protein [Gemmobacter caeruleus]|uniref:amidohydrolase family protein n=1 Tax=Gemmobacter caeruleus TaxID=2595004 RepID=UPI0013968042|nr:amidohydrolase family protein [Gemmobacter caeruleus]
MTPIRITNCHTHTFTEAHIPSRYPHWGLMPFKRAPVLVRGLAGLARLLGHEGAADGLRRLHRFQAEARAPGQAAILERLIAQYPRGTRFVVLPMQMAGMGQGACRATLAAQHDELADLARACPGIVIPFAACDPRLPGAAEEVRRCIEDLGFRGLKLYPRLGYAPDHPLLMREVYPLLDARGLAVVSHCSRGGVTGNVTRAEADALSHPRAFAPVLRAFPHMQVNLAHMGGQTDWESYIAEGIDPYDPQAQADNFLIALREMIESGDFPNLWTDVSYTLFQSEAFLPFLRLFLDHPALRARTLFGSDFYMTRQEALSERAVAVRLRAGLGEALFRQIAETNPEQWLGEARVAQAGCPARAAVA